MGSYMLGSKGCSSEIRMVDGWACVGSKDFSEV